MQDFHNFAREKLQTKHYQENPKSKPNFLFDIPIITVDPAGSSKLKQYVC